MKKRPEEGDRVLVQCFWSDTERIGVVDSLLDIQFTWVDQDNGQTFFTNYNGEWKFYERD